MKFSPEIEHDLRELEEKMKKRSARKRWILVLGSGVFVLWCAIMLGVACDAVPAKSIASVILEASALTLIFPGIGLLIWGVVLALNYFMPLD